MLTAGPAWADWVRHGEEPWGVYYYDPATIKRDGNLARVWTLLNRKTSHPTPLGLALSSRVLLEFDCTRKRVRQLAYSEHSEAMAGGNTLGFIETPDGGITGWEDISRKTPAGLLLTIICR